MSSPWRMASRLLLFTLCCLYLPLPAASQTVRQTGPARDGQHDFDFNFGTWRTEIKRLQHPLTGSKTWLAYTGTHVVRKVWNGRANLGELEIDGPTGHIEGLSLRLYNPQSHQWNLLFASSGGGTLSVPMVGEFRDGRGEFFDQETFNGRAILARTVWSDITSTSCRSEQAFSDDGGKTWEVNWIAVDTLVKDAAAAEQGARTGSARDGSHDFDFNFGAWKTHITRLKQPLTGSTASFEVNGTVLVRPVWNGRANLEEIEAEGPKGHVEGLTLRLYNPESHQWGLSWASSNDGTINQPLVGEFKDGRGEFDDQETFNGRTILVRQVYSKITTSTHHFEQAFSGDGGKSWEANWTADLTRVGP
jgi:hypothetical protein